VTKFRLAEMGDKELDERSEEIPEIGKSDAVPRSGKG
jgi:hypothetical protein